MALRILLKQALLLPELWELFFSLVIEAIFELCKKLRLASFLILSFSNVFGYSEHCEQSYLDFPHYQCN